MASAEKNRSVAVIDIGSNSIKVLVAMRGRDGTIVPLRTRTVDARISAGISHAMPQLTEEGMGRGVEAIRTLLNDAADFSPSSVVLVATSAVRDAQNGDVFCRRVHAATGQDIRVLTGAEEAGFIGRGLASDPGLRGLTDFYVFDLGGGSLECLAFRGRQVEQATSLQLGAVRLTEKFVSDVNAPISAQALTNTTNHVRAAFAGAGFEFALPRGVVAVGTGGSVATVRAILGARIGLRFEQTPPVITVSDARQLLEILAALPLSQRKEISGLPAARADIFPVALATLITVAELGGFLAYHNSVYNLRYGIADEALT